MNGIDRLGPLPAAAAVGAGVGADAMTRTLIGEVGARVTGWAAATFGGNAGAGWSAVSGAAGFGPDAGRLAQGDAYGLRDLAGGVASRLGATPAQEGALLRALEDFTRAAALNVNALAGSGNELSALSATLDVTGDVTGNGSGVDGVVSRLEIATQRLETHNL